MTEMATPKFDFISKTNGALALSVARWLADKDYGVAIQQADDGVVTITYADNHGDGQIWPSVYINAGKIKFPKGTPENLILAFFKSDLVP